MATPQIILALVLIALFAFGYVGLIIYFFIAARVHRVKPSNGIDEDGR